MTDSAPTPERRCEQTTEHPPHGYEYAFETKCHCPGVAPTPDAVPSVCPGEDMRECGPDAGTQREREEIARAYCPDGSDHEWVSKCADCGYEPPVDRATREWHEARRKAAAPKAPCTPYTPDTARESDRLTYCVEHGQLWPHLSNSEGTDAILIAECEKYAGSEASAIVTTQVRSLLAQVASRLRSLHPEGDDVH